MITVRLTRDSVCAGDDADAPHERVVKFDPDREKVSATDESWFDVLWFVNEMSRGYLPGVNGAGHCWSAFLNGKFIATITAVRGWPSVDELDFEPENELHFKYHPARY